LHFHKESEILHTPKLVRYGHRWCNIAMADHSVEETVDFMKAVVKAHEKRSKNM
jgi:protein-tyrosine phosphatase